MARFYKLKNKEIVPCGLMEWAETMGRGDHILWHNQYLLDRAELVSTVFVGHCQTFDVEDGAIPPNMFESMHFPGNESRSCSTYDEAEKQHQEMVAEWLKDVN